jgi:hypothetical protein
VYLPKLEAEEADAYKRRLMMTPFFNASWRTIVGLRGMLFRKPPKIDVPDEIKPITEDIDLAGTPLTSFAQDVVEESLTVGRVGILVDYPVASETMTMADVKQNGLRAMMSIYEAENIINWRTKRVNGATILSMVVLTETGELEGEDEFTRKTEKHYRVLDLVEGKYRQRLYRSKDSSQDGTTDEQIGGDIYPIMNGSPLDYIPFIFVGVDDTTPDVDAPPLIDLVTTNFKHYGQATSYERGCFFSGLPTLFISGLNDPDKKIYIGGDVANILPDSQASAVFVEVMSGFTALRTNLEDKKAEMAILGARMLEAGRTGGAIEAAETVARRQSGEQSVLACMAQTASDGLTKALQWLADWQGIKATVKIDLNRDFLPMPMDAPTLTAMVSAWQSGAISKETLFDNLQQGELVDPDVTFDDEEARINANPASMPTLGGGGTGTRSGVVDTAPAPANRGSGGATGKPNLKAV